MRGPYCSLDACPADVAGASGRASIREACAISCPNSDSGSCSQWTDGQERRWRMKNAARLYTQLWGVLLRLRRLVLGHNVPYIQQLTSTDCGAACLAMVLSALGRPTTLNELRPMCPTGRDGLGVSTLARLGRSFGLRVKAYAAELNQIRDVPLPAIAHWRFNHFIVLAEVSARRVEIVDPASGRYQMTLEDSGKD